MMSIPLVLTEEESEQDIIRRAKNGDQAAFGSLVVKYQKSVYNIARRIVLNHQDADDVVQETFIKIYSHINDYSEKYKFFTWIYRITVNTALTVLKRRKNRGVSLEMLVEEEYFQPAANSNSQRDYREKELKLLVKKGLEKLSPELRSVFVLRTWGELSYEEIAETLKISKGTVMSRLNRARAKLQKSLKKYGVFHE